ncbi:MAG: hypothetical protein LBF09_04630 [Odoribacteraceae bacterium]|jgi:hypothetical protein|nr:hypothetical protein [Odoribacteraceae bacterium]
MKRVIAILLLIVLPATAIRPTIAVHYCGGRLHAVGLAGEDVSAGCCAGEMNENEQEGTNVTDPAARCCSTRVFEVTTDDGQRRATDVAARVPAMPLSPCPSLGASPVALPLPVPRPVAPAGKHPPSVDLLTLIRVARV